MFQDLAVTDDRHNASAWRSRWYYRYGGARVRRRSARGSLESTRHPNQSSTVELNETSQNPDKATTAPTVQSSSADSLPCSRSDTPTTTTATATTATLSAELFPRDLWQPDETAAPRPHYRALTHTEPVGRDTVWKHQAYSEATLLMVLDVPDREALERWVAQPWVVRVYDEYARAVLDNPTRQLDEQGCEIRRSWPQYTINNALEALRSRAPRYLAPPSDKGSWTVDDHDIRFIVQLVESSRQPGRC
ncbi:hypothetical protein ABEF95_001152 [Exophiala dermatitidis]